MEASRGLKHEKIKVQNFDPKLEPKLNDTLSSLSLDNGLSLNHQVNDQEKSANKRPRPERLMVHPKSGVRKAAMPIQPLEEDGDFPSPSSINHDHHQYINDDGSLWKKVRKAFDYSKKFDEVKLPNEYKEAIRPDEIESSTTRELILTGQEGGNGNSKRNVPVTSTPNLPTEQIESQDLNSVTSNVLLPEWQESQPVIAGYFKREAELGIAADLESREEAESSSETWPYPKSFNVANNDPVKERQTPVKGPKVTKSRNLFSYNELLQTELFNSAQKHLRWLVQSVGTRLGFTESQKNNLSQLGISDKQRILGLEAPCLNQQEKFNVIFAQRFMDVLIPGLENSKDRISSLRKYLNEIPEMSDWRKNR